MVGDDEVVALLRGGGFEIVATTGLQDPHRIQARPSLVAAARNAGKPVQGLRAWALAVQDRSNHNKACCALANKLARIAYACLRDHAAYGEKVQLDRKIDRQAFAIPAGALAS